MFPCFIEFKPNDGAEDILVDVDSSEDDSEDVSAVPLISTKLFVLILYEIVTDIPKAIQPKNKTDKHNRFPLLSCILTFCNTIGLKQLLRKCI